MLLCLSLCCRLLPHLETANGASLILIHTCACTVIGWPLIRAGANLVQANARHYFHLDGCSHSRPIDPQFREPQAYIGPPSNGATLRCREGAARQAWLQSRSLRECRLHSHRVMSGSSAATWSSHPAPARWCRKLGLSVFFAATFSCSNQSNITPLLIHTMIHLRPQLAVKLSSTRLPDHRDIAIVYAVTAVQRV